MNNSEYHWLLTMQWTAPNGSLNVWTEAGVIGADGRTRAQLLEFLLTQAASRHGAPPARTSLLFFSLEPNELGRAA